MFKCIVSRSLIAAFLLLPVSTIVSADFLFSAPPVESLEYSKRLYDPIAAYLSEVTGETVTYRYSGNWPNYILKMQQASYDFIIDAPHFISWRIENIGHTALAMLAPNLKFSVASEQSGEISTLLDLRGRAVCSSSVPDLDAITLLDQYDSTWTLPKIIPVGGHEALYNGLADGVCSAVILPQRVYRRLSARPGSDPVTVLFESHDLPHYGLSSSPSVSPDIMIRIRQGLDSARGRDAMAGLMDYFGLARTDLTTQFDSEVYAGYAYLLDEFWGF